MRAWSRLPMARSRSGISAIFASKSLSPSALFAAVFVSLTRSFIAARSSAENASRLFFGVVLLADFRVAFIRGFLPASIDGNTLILWCLLRRWLLESCSIASLPIEVIKRVERCPPARLMTAVHRPPAHAPLARHLHDRPPLFPS